MPEGPAKDQIVSEEVLEKAKIEYYDMRGWDPNGIPTKEKLNELKI
ncbi:MAG: aldehyde ferredoxin oxidoreductase C-terminal domain-containing protein [Candidatus Heimdallarchaeaceae archaeon]